MRRTYLEEFTELTHFAKNKKNQDPEYYIECLHRFIKEVISDSQLTKKMPSLKLMTFFLGSIFYPKNMKLVHKSAS